MTEDQILEEACKIAEDIYEEHGVEVHGNIDLDQARLTVESYGYEGKELEEIAKSLVVVMEGV